jgi:hypothetical protein
VRMTSAALWAAATRRTWKTLLLPRPTRIALSPARGRAEYGDGYRIVHVAPTS